LRIPIIGGNWKMNKGTLIETQKMLENLIPLIESIEDVDIVVAPPYTTLSKDQNRSTKHVF
jgi:triosephosphate isomerase